MHIKLFNIVVWRWTVAWMSRRTDCISSTRRCSGGFRGVWRRDLKGDCSLLPLPVELSRRRFRCVRLCSRCPFLLSRRVDVDAGGLLSFTSSAHRDGGGLFWSSGSSPSVIMLALLYLYERESRRLHTRTSSKCCSCAAMPDRVRSV